MVHDPARRVDGARILVVEDNEDFRLLLEVTLRDEGFAVDAASCAEDGIRLIATGRYQLVLSDYSLPGHSGSWLLSEAKRFHRGQGIPSLIITGDPDAPGLPDDVVVVPKPVDFDRLLGDLRRMLGGDMTSTPHVEAWQPHQPYMRQSPPQQKDSSLFS
jgi:DNA-binding NtrC family response regulator